MLSKRSSSSSANLPQSDKTVIGCDGASVDGCVKSYYLANGSCFPCPPRCALCTSETKCSLCKNGFYGPVCQSACRSRCEEPCHKEFGHCTYGCPDGQFPLEGSPECSSCKQNCRICDTSSNCLQCKDGFFGKICDERCSFLCQGNICNQSSGICLTCRDRYFKSNLGHCSKCSDGCANCSSVTNCSECQDGYFGPFKGQCILECPIQLDEHYTTWQSQGRCGLLVGENITMPASCQDIKRQSFTCNVEGNCVNCSTPSNGFGFSDVIGDRCGACMFYHCTHKCHHLDDGYSGAMHSDGYKCVKTCTLHESEITNETILCINSKSAMLLPSGAMEAAVSCLSDGRLFPVLDVVLACGAVGVVVVVTVAGCIYWFRNVRKVARNSSSPSPVGRDETGMIYIDDETVVIHDDAVERLVGEESTAGPDQAIADMDVQAEEVEPSREEAPTSLIKFWPFKLFRK